MVIDRTYFITDDLTIIDAVCTILKVIKFWLGKEAILFSINDRDGDMTIQIDDKNLA